MTQDVFDNADLHDLYNGRSRVVDATTVCDYPGAADDWALSLFGRAITIVHLQ